MKITQADADRITLNIQYELKSLFGDYEHTNLETTIKIKNYCQKKYQECDHIKESIAYSYWYVLYRSYEKAIGITEDTIKFREGRKKQKRELLFEQIKKCEYSR